MTRKEVQMPMPKNSWSKEQSRLLKEHYPTMNTRELASLIGKPVSAVKSRAASLGLLKDADYTVHSSLGIWNTETDKLLIEKYPNTTNKQLSKFFNVPEHSIQNRARRLGLSKDPDFMNQMNGTWPAEQVEFLKENFGKLTRREIAEKLGRTPGAVKSKATQLGLKADPKHLAQLIRKNLNRSTYKKGDKPINTMCDGAITLHIMRNSPPYYYIRLSEKNWMPLHQYLWEKINGQVPDGHIISFKDGNSLNMLLDNLELITLQANAIRNSGALNLADGFVAATMSRRDPETKKELLKHPDLIETKRMQLKLNRELKTKTKRKDESDSKKA